MDKDSVKQVYKKDRKKLYMFLTLFIITMFAIFVTHRLFVVTKEHRQYMIENPARAKIDEVNSLTASEVTLRSTKAIDNALAQSINENVPASQPTNPPIESSKKEVLDRRTILLEEFDRIEDE